jgi:class 3 adenylate cyclase
LVFQAAGRPAVASPAWPRMVRLRLDSGDAEGAKKMLAAKPDWLRPQEPLDTRLAAGLVNLAELYFELEHLDEAVSLKQTLATIVEQGIQTPYAPYFPLPYRLLGMIGAVQSRWTEAEANFQKAMELCQTNGLRVELAATCRSYGHMFFTRNQPGDIDRAMPLLNRALKLYQEMNMKVYVERVLRARLEAQRALAAQAGLLNGTAGAERRRARKTSLELLLPLTLDDQQSALTRASPEGTVTILFTDIEGSTEMTERLGDRRWLELLRGHNRILREQLARHGGHEVKAVGDGFMVAFASAARALSSAVDIERAFARHNETAKEPINVRIGLNTGESIEEEGDYFGTAVTLAARIADKAKGGQILVSEVVRTVVGSLAGVEFRDAGRRQLKGVKGRQRLYEVVW